MVLGGQMGGWPQLPRERGRGSWVQETLQCRFQHSSHVKAFQAFEEATVYVQCASLAAPFPNPDADVKGGTAGVHMSATKVRLL